MSSVDPFSRPGEIVHGALDYAELAALGLNGEDVVDFSANTNPFGPSPRVRKSLASVPLDRYPDRDAWALRRAVAERWNVPLEQVIAGNGATKLIGLIATALLRPNDDVLILAPTYGEYARVTELVGARTHFVTARTEDSFTLEDAVVEEQLRRLVPRLVFLCRPNNPTGTMFDLKTIAAWANGFPKTTFVVDEAYLEFTGQASAVTLEAANVVVLRSMTKAYALAGLRLGVAIGPATMLDELRRVRSPWSVNALAQAAGVAALADDEHLATSLAELAVAKRRLVLDLHAAAFLPLESRTHFFLLPVGDAARVRAALLRRGLVVRDGTSFGLPQYVRIGTQRVEQNERLVAALREVV